MSIKLNTVGRNLFFNTCIDLSGADDYEVEFFKPGGNSVTIPKSELVLGLMDVTDPTSGEIFLANEYLVYTLKTGDIDVVGLWKYRVNATFTAPDRYLPGTIGKFQVKK